jgi:hypothetical protein
MRAEPSQFVADHERRYGVKRISEKPMHAI